MGQLNARVLLADDEEELLSTLAAAARAKGYETWTACNGTQAFALLRDRPYDVVVTDLHMPGLDGPELLRLIQNEGILTRVVVITGFATLDAAVDCLRKGAMDFLTKPVEVEVLLRSLEKTLERPLPQALKARGTWAAVADRFGLTHRQVKLLEALYVTGKSNRDLAEELCLSTHTVKSHLKAAFLKLGISTRAQLFRVLREMEE